MLCFLNLALTNTSDIDSQLGILKEISLIEWLAYSYVSNLGSWEYFACAFTDVSL